MRKITISKWKVKSPAGEELEDSILTVLNVLIGSSKAEDMPKGLDSFRVFKRLANAFEKAETSNVLELEENDYSFLKRLVELGIPSVWAMNKNINEAVEAFLSAKE